MRVSACLAVFHAALHYLNIFLASSRAKSYNPRQKSWHTCPLLQYLSRKFISSPPSPQFNAVYRDEVVIARFQHCQGGRGFLIPVRPLVIVSKIACQRMFQLSDPGVPRTFVEDCRFYAGTSATHAFLTTKISLGSSMEKKRKLL